MKYIRLLLLWFVCALFFMLFVITLSLGRLIPSIPLLVICIITSPPAGTLFKKRSVRIAMYFARGILVLVLLFAFIMLSFIHSVNEPLYKSDELKSAFIRIYDSKLGQWPVSYETRSIETECGEVFVIMSGPEDAPPLLLFHASSMGSWSWLYNIETLAQNHRTYAVDFIGEPGKSELIYSDKIPQDSKSLDEFYREIIGKLGITGNYSITGASFGGYIAVNHAILSPKRIDKIVLLSPMGLTPATSSVNTKLILYSLFPLKIFENSMLYWAMGDDPKVLNETEEWFRLVLDGVSRKGPPPLTFEPEQLKKIRTPVLLVLGSNDRLVGDPEAVKPLAENVPQIKIKVISSAHLMGCEKAGEVNTLMKEFLEE